MLVREEKTALLEAVRKEEDNGNNRPPLNGSLNILRFHQILRLNKSFHSFPLLSCYFKPLLLKDDSKLFTFSLIGKPFAI
jgi:hypothetical protein